MKLLITIFLIFQIRFCFGQNVKLEITDYSQKIDGKEYATYQFVYSSYSSSRPTVIFITTKDLLLELTTKIPPLFKIKQEYTDVWVLGIKGFNQKDISEVDRKIIDSFLNKIIKYRNDNDLPPFTIQRLQESKVFIEKKDEVCKFISCRNHPWE